MSRPPDQNEQMQPLKMDRPLPEITPETTTTPEIKAETNINIIREHDDDEGAAALVINFFSQNIGRVTSVVREELKELIKRYSAARVREAIKLGALNGARSVKYVRAILENENEGAGDGGEEKDLVSQPEPLAATGVPKKGGWPPGPRPRTTVTCRRCGMPFNTVVPKFKPPRDVCQRCVREESRREAAWKNQLAGKGQSPGRVSRNPRPVQHGNFAICGYIYGERNHYERGNWLKFNYLKSLILGLPADDGKLHWSGICGNGFNEPVKDLLCVTLQGILVDSPLVDLPEKAVLEDGNHTLWPSGKTRRAWLAEQVYWVQPRLIAEVKYSKLTAKGWLLSPVFKRLRPDLTLDDIRRGMDNGTEAQGSGVFNESKSFAT